MFTPHVDNNPTHRGPTILNPCARAYAGWCQVFTNYDDFQEQKFLYKDHEWTCCITNRSGLTFEEVGFRASMFRVPCRPEAPARSAGNALSAGGHAYAGGARRAPLSPRRGAGNLAPWFAAPC